MEFCEGEKQLLGSSPLEETDEKREEIGTGGLKDSHAVPRSLHLSLNTTGSRENRVGGPNMTGHFGILDVAKLRVIFLGKTY